MLTLLLPSYLYFPDPALLEPLLRLGCVVRLFRVHVPWPLAGLRLQAVPRQLHACVYGHRHDLCCSFRGENGRCDGCSWLLNCIKRRQRTWQVHLTSRTSINPHFSCLSLSVSVYDDITGHIICRVMRLLLCVTLLMYIQDRFLHRIHPIV